MTTTFTTATAGPDAKLLRLFRVWARNETRYEALRKSDDDRVFDEIGQQA